MMILKIIRNCYNNYPIFTFRESQLRNFSAEFFNYTPNSSTLSFLLCNSTHVSCPLEVNYNEIFPSIKSVHFLLRPIML